MEEVFGSDGAEAAALAQQVQDALSLAEFGKAAEANAKLAMLAHSIPARLFSAYTAVRLADYQAEPLQAFDVVERIEQPYAESSKHSSLERQWYILSWLSVPFTCDYPIDVFYLHHLALELPEQVARQRCLARAVRYAVQYKDHPYMTFLLEHPQSQLDGVGDPYYSSVIAFYRALYRRLLAELPQQADSLLRAAANPLQAYAAQRTIAQYSHLWQSN